MIKLCESLFQQARLWQADAVAVPVVNGMECRGVNLAFTPILGTRQAFTARKTGMARACNVSYKQWACLFISHCCSSIQQLRNHPQIYLTSEHSATSTATCSRLKIKIGGWKLPSHTTQQISFADSSKERVLITAISAQTQQPPGNGP